jgi:hypothetical protein
MLDVPTVLAGFLYLWQHSKEQKSTNLSQPAFVTNTTASAAPSF